MTVNSKIKKILSITIAIVMFMSCLPVSSFAEGISAIDGDFTYNVIFDWINGTGSAVITGYSGSDSYVLIPETCTITEGEAKYIVNVIGIGDNAFANNKTLETVRGGSKIRSVGKGAFSGCSNLSTCIFTSNVTLDESAFAECPALDIVAFNSVVHAPITLERGPDESDEDYLARLTAKTNDLIGSIFKKSGHPRYTFSNTANLQYYSGSLINGSIVMSEQYVYGNIGGSNAVLLGLIKPGELADENKHLSIASSVNEIVSAAFYGHTEIIDITLPSILKRIGSMAFQNCVGLESFTVPSGTKTIGHHAFTNCIGLTELELPDSIQSIGPSSFQKCTGLKTLSLGTGLDEIPYKAFLGCTGLTDITFSDGLTSIGLEAFEECTGLKNITLPTTIKSIGSSAFVNCTGLETVSIPAASEYIIDVAAFSYCSGLKSVDFNSKLAVLSQNAFSNCSALEELVNFDTCSALTSIEKDAFAYCCSLKNVKIPESVLVIGQNAFTCCESMTALELNAKLSKIGQEAFKDCSGLAEIEVLNDVTVIDKAAFKGCSSLTKAVIGNSVTEVSESLFEDCSSLSELTFGGAITAIGNNAFKNCASLPEAVIPDAVTIIKDSTFEGCTSLADIVFGANVATIGKYAFAGCTALTDVSIPVKVTEIKDGAFAGCSALEKILVPASVTSIGAGVFENCDKLTVYCYSNSTALAYARANGINYIVLDCAHANTEWVVDIEATCTEDGLKHKECTDCGASLEQEDIPANGHSYGEWEVTLEATCTTDGSKHRICSVCEDEEIEVISQTGHTPSSLQTEEATCTQDGRTYYVCTVCGVEYDVTPIQAPGHSISDWIIDKDATCTEDGEKHRECTVCGFKYDKEVITAPGHNSTDWILDYNATATTEGRKHKECSVCGIELEVFVIPAFGGEHEYKILSETDKTCVITGYLGNDTELVLPAELNGYTVVAIGASAYEGNDKITSVTIPDTVKVISESAFLRCTNLSEVNFGSGLEEIGQQAFYGCDSLTEVTLPEGIKTIKNDAFRNNANLESINLPDSLEYIAPYAFDGCVNLVDNVEYNEGSYAAQYVADNGLVSGNTDKDIAKIEITSLPDKLVYSIGEELDLTGLVVTATYKDGTTAVIDDYGYMGFESSTAGERAIVISVGTRTANFTYTVIGMMCDVSQDGKISVVDAKMILQYLAGSRTLTDGQLAVADVNGDGKVSVVDAKWILQSVAGLRELGK